MVEITPSSLSYGGSMHQKQPPAKVALAVSVGPVLGVAAYATSIANGKIIAKTNTALSGFLRFLFLLRELIVTAADQVRPKFWVLVMVISLARCHALYVR